MLGAPKQNWDVYHKLTVVHDRQFVRNLSIAQRYALYIDLFQIVCGHPREPAEQERLATRRWQQKLALRHKQNRAFGSTN